MNEIQAVFPLPGAHLELERMPGHWLLARLGKTVLRPGGVELTTQMLDALAIDANAAVVELAPGLGATARLTLARRPKSYVGVERDATAAAGVSRMLTDPRDRCVQGTAAATGLDSKSATVVYGEAMLTMNTSAQKESIVREAFRVLEPGGRYGIHELGLTPNTIAQSQKDDVMRDLSKAIRVGARPLTQLEWRAVLESAGFVIEMEATAPMHLLELPRMVQDEGLLGTLRILGNIATMPAARRRVLEMHRVFRKYMKVLCAVALVARKPHE